MIACWRVLGIITPPASNHRWRPRLPPDSCPAAIFDSCEKEFVLRRLGCIQSDHASIGRRELLQVGALSLLGAGLGDLLRMEAQAANPKARKRAKAVIFIFQSGGPSQHETFDPKPDAPEGIRGEYGTT